MTDDRAGQSGRPQASTVVLVAAGPAPQRGLEQDLRRHGIALHRASTAREGIERALSVRPDVIVLDATMADAGAIELLRALRREPALDTVPVIVLSAEADPAARILALREGANDVVAASCDAAELAARIAAQRASVERVRGVERRLLAREVHDRLGQLLTAANIDLRLLERRTEDGAALPPRDELLRELGAARASIGQAIASVQDIALLLRPPAPDAGGLAAALRRQADAFQQRFRIACAVRLLDAIDPEPAPAVAGELLCICQEALANVLRHADATQVQVQLAVRGRQLLLRVSDNGVGIPRGAADAPASIGIAGMRERAGGIGARLQVRGRRGCGTIVSVRVMFSQPVPPAVGI